MRDEPARAGGVAARARVVDVLDRFRRLDPEGLTLVALEDDDPNRRAARARARAAAHAAGLGKLLDEGTRSAADLVLREFAEGSYRPQPFGLNWGQSLGTAQDRAGIALAVQDAVAVAIVEDLLPEADSAVLATPFETLEVADRPGSTPTLAAIGWLPTWMQAAFLVVALAGIAWVVFVASLGASSWQLGLSVLAPVAILVALYRRARRPA